jgi:hypothetical protein
MWPLFHHFTPMSSAYRGSLHRAYTGIRLPVSSSTTALPFEILLPSMGSGHWSSIWCRLRRMSSLPPVFPHVQWAHSTRQKQQLRFGTGVLTISIRRQPSSSHWQQYVSVLSTILGSPARFALLPNQWLSSCNSLHLVLSSPLLVSISTYSSLQGDTTAIAGSCILWTIFPKCISSTPRKVKTRRRLRFSSLLCLSSDSFSIWSCLPYH